MVDLQQHWARSICNCGTALTHSLMRLLHRTANGLCYMTGGRRQITTQAISAVSTYHTGRFYTNTEGKWFWGVESIHFYDSLRQVGRNLRQAFSTAVYDVVVAGAGGRADGRLGSAWPWLHLSRTWGGEKDGKTTDQEENWLKTTWFNDTRKQMENTGNINTILSQIWIE